MTAYSHKSIFTLLLLITAISVSSAHRRRPRRSRHFDNTEQYLRDLCSKTDRSDVCLNIFKSEPHRFDNTDEGGIVAGVIDLTIAKSKQIGDQLNQWYKDSNDDKMKQKYHSCSENYFEANRYLVDAQRNNNYDDYRRISDQIDDGEKELEQCRREFVNSADPGHVGDRNNELGLYLDMVRAATGRVRVEYYYDEHRN